MRATREAMRALRAHAPTRPETLVHEQAPVPEPGIGDVLVRVHTASFTPTEMAWPSTWVDRAGRDPGVSLWDGETHTETFLGGDVSRRARSGQAGRHMAGRAAPRPRLARDA
jgi:NADPH:quinone reductase-like Zn-dependent oxidoreductase